MPIPVQGDFVHETVPYRNLPILLGLIRQEAGEGELVLEQNDGLRRLYFRQGELVHLRSDATGEQFGSYLLRTGILEYSALKELLANEEHYRLGEKVIQWGMMTLEERDRHLQNLQELVMLHALEHPVLAWSWQSGTMERLLSGDLHFHLPHRPFIWRAFQELRSIEELRAILESESAWKWEGRGDLLELLGDLPLTPTTAYALSCLSSDPVTFETFRYLSSLDAEEACRFIASLWALGALALACEGVPVVTRPRVYKAAELKPLAPMPAPPRVTMPRPVPPGSGVPLILPPKDHPFGAPKRRAPEFALDLSISGMDPEPQFLDLDPQPAPRPLPLPLDQDEDAFLGRDDLPPCGPRPQPRPSLREDLPPCGPRPEPRLRPASEDLPPCGPRPEPRPLVLEPPIAAPPQELRPLPGLQFPSTEIDLDPNREGAPAPPTPTAASEAQALLERARRQAKLGRTVEAIYTLEQAVQVVVAGPIAFDAWLLLGQLRKTNPSWTSRALAALQSAARLRARAPEPWIAMGEIHLRAGARTEALACYRKALELDPALTLPPELDPKPPRPAPGSPQKKGFFGRG